MRLATAATALLTLALATTGLAAPSQDQDAPETGLAKRAAWEDTIWLTSADDFCQIMPKTRMRIGDSEYPGGTRSYCTKPANAAQGRIKPGLWTSKNFSKARGKYGKQVQLTGCINPYASTRLVPNDDGGQYDALGGPDGKGNPRNSVCLGYKAYVELIEPAARRACIRCCEDPRDCRLDLDTAGCPAVIKGNYSGCA